MFSYYFAVSEVVGNLPALLAGLFYACQHPIVYYTAKIFAGHEHTSLCSALCVSLLVLGI